MEAALAVIKEHRITLDAIEAIHVQSSQLALDAAGKMEPATGLEGKFSIPYCVANALMRGNTGIAAFTDEMVGDPRIRALMQKITVTLEPDFKTLECRVAVKRKGGKAFSGFSDILRQIPPLEEKKSRVRNKYVDLCEPVLGQATTAEIASEIQCLEDLGEHERLCEEAVRFKDLERSQDGI